MDQPTSSTTTSNSEFLQTCDNNFDSPFQDETTENSFEISVPTSTSNHQQSQTTSGPAVLLLPDRQRQPVSVTVLESKEEGCKQESYLPTLIDWTLEHVVCAGFCTNDHWLDDDEIGNHGIPTSTNNHSLYRKTMTTAAIANGNDEGVPVSLPAPLSSSSPVPVPATEQQASAPQPFNNLGLRQTAAMARGFADDAGRAIGNLLPTASLQQITTRKYTLPDKTVASQVLMYRQLLHTKCRPGLKLSRDFQATVAQKAVMHMPWWEQGIEETKKMVISYDNLITRLWLNGAIDPFNRDTAIRNEDAVDLIDIGTVQPAESTVNDNATTTSVETYITEEGLPPVPHPLWVERLGFQQPDPVTDFRSGGVLSLAMMVYMVESQPEICQRFFTGDASVLPFGITCINVTDMIAKFLMLAKATDRMDALLSQKPFWRMFADPNAILAVQELAMNMLADVVVELSRERQIPILAKQHSTSMPGDFSDKVCIEIDEIQQSLTPIIHPSTHSSLFCVCKSNI